MIFFNRLYIVVVALIVIAVPVMSQDRDFISDEGEVVEGEFVINKELEITLPSAQRIFGKVPPDEIDKKETQPIQYVFKDYTPQLIDIPTRLRVLKLKDPLITHGPSSYLKLGFGNYFTPLFQLGVNSGPDKQANYGLRMDHLSSKNGPVDKQNSGDSRTSFGVFGKYIGDVASVDGDLEFNRLGYNFYGYGDSEEVDRDTIKQNFNDIRLAFNINNAKADAPFNYHIYGRVHRISDKFDASEFGFNGGVEGNYAIGESMVAGLALDYNFGAYKNPESINRSLVRVYPRFAFVKNGFNIDAGFKVLSHNDTLNNKNKTRVYPSVKVSYDLTDNFSAYGKLDGDVEALTFRDVVYDNPYVNSSLPLNHTIKNMELTLGVKGKLVRFLAYDAGVRSALYKNMYFYINDPTAFNKFTLIYDEGTTSLFQVFASLSYMKSNVMGSTLSLKLNAYKTDEVAKAWHKPKLEFDYSIWYNIYNKVKLSADIFAISGIQAVDRRPATQQTVKLDAALDMSFKVDYILSERYGVFVSINNLLNRNYERYYRYPSRGLLAIVGVSVSF
jgi:hypothetical protein